MRLNGWHVVALVGLLLGAAVGSYALGSETIAAAIVALLGGWLTPSPLARDPA